MAQALRLIYKTAAMNTYPWELPSGEPWVVNFDNSDCDEEKWWEHESPADAGGHLFEMLVSLKFRGRLDAKQAVLASMTLKGSWNSEKAF